MCKKNNFCELVILTYNLFLSSSKIVFLVQFENKDDGTFWISFCDFKNFFYLTAICNHHDTYHKNMIDDSHVPYDGFGLAKFTLESDHSGYLVVSVDQIHARFFDKPAFIGT